MGAELELILKVALFSLMHWLLVSLALGNLVETQQVLGRRKAPWVAAIVLLTCLGPIFYLMLHPAPQTQGDR